MKIILPPETPLWMVNIAKQIEQNFVDAYPKYPVRLPSFQSVDLPDPKKYPNSMIWVSDLNSSAYSNGINWLSSGVAPITSPGVPMIISDTDPALSGTYVWIQTGLPDGTYSVWVNE